MMSSTAIREKISFCQSFSFGLSAYGIGNRGSFAFPSPMDEKGAEIDQSPRP
jgi:hypothetical protein